MSLNWSIRLARARLSGLRINFVVGRTNFVFDGLRFIRFLDLELLDTNLFPRLIKAVC